MLPARMIERCEFQCRFGGGEINDGLGAGNRLQRVIGDGQADVGPAHRRPRIHAHPIVACPFDHAHQPHLVAGQHGFDQHLAHAARSPCDRDAGKVCHGSVL